MKKMIVFLVLAAIAIMFVEGCATAMSSNEYAVDMLSKKPGVSFQIYNRKGKYIHHGVTPQIAVLPSSSDFFEKQILTIKSVQGKKVVNERTLTGAYSPWFWGNIVSGGLGCIVDGFTGAMWSFPKDCYVDKGKEQYEKIMHLNL